MGLAVLRVWHSRRTLRMIGICVGRAVGRLGRRTVVVGVMVRVLGVLRVLAGLSSGIVLLRGPVTRRPGI